VLERRWSFGELLGYLRSWSAVAACAAATGEDPVAAMEAELAPAWGPPEARRLVRWPVALRAGRRP